MSELLSKVAVVTGATSGIGRQTALLMKARGWIVVATGRNEKALNKLFEEGIDAIYPCDLSTPDAARDLIDYTLETFDQLDSLIHAAGILTGGGMDNESDEGFLRLMDVNVNASWYVLKAAWEALKESKGSAVIVSSVTGLRAFPGLMGYCVSKAAVDQMIRCAALDGAPFGVRVNGVNPGVVVTNLHKAGGMDNEAYAKFLEHSKTTHPLGRVGEADEVAESIVWLADENTQWITGISLPIDGGRQLTCNR